MAVVGSIVKVHPAWVVPERRGGHDPRPWPGSTSTSTIRTRPISSQDELAEGLSALGYSVTQATISRDLEHIGAYARGVAAGGAAAVRAYLDEYIYGPETFDAYLERFGAGRLLRQQRAAQELIR